MSNIGQGSIEVARGEAPAASASLSMCNICTKGAQTSSHSSFGSGGGKKMGLVVSLEIEAMVKRFGLDRIGFLTITFADNVTEINEAQRRFHSLRTHVIGTRYERSIAIWERQKSGRIHFHLLIVCGTGIRQGIDFDAIKRGDYRSAGHELRAEWAFWRGCKTDEKAGRKGYKIGRCELMPIRSNGEAIARYVSKYVTKNFGEREERDKGARIVRFIGFKPEDRCARASFAWATDYGWLWRKKLGLWCVLFGINHWSELGQIEIKNEPVRGKWAYYVNQSVNSMVLGSIEGFYVYPDRGKAEADGHDVSEEWEGEVRIEVKQNRWIL